MEKWTLLDSKYIIQRPWATLRLDKLQLPNGHIKDEYYVMEYPDWVNMVGITDDGYIIFIKQYRHGTQDILLEIPAGVIEPGEDPADAARREMLEETGYVFDTIEKVCELYPNPSSTNNISHTYILRGGKEVQDQELDDSEDIEVLKLSVAEARELLYNNEIKQSLHASALFYCLAKLNLL